MCKIGFTELVELLDHVVEDEDLLCILLKMTKKLSTLSPNAIY